MKDLNNTEVIAGDRRRNTRYAINLELRWRAIRRKRVLFAGAGTTLDLSTSGVLFATDRPLSPGLTLKLSIAWPVLLNGVAPLQLVVSGNIVRLQGLQVAMRIKQHEFRTRGASLDLMPAGDKIWGQAASVPQRNEGQCMENECGESGESIFLGKFLDPDYYTRLL